MQSIKTFMPFIFISIILISLIIIPRFFHKNQTLTDQEQHLAKQLTFDPDVLLIVKQATNKPIQQLTSFNFDTDEQHPINGITSAVSASQSRTIQAKLHQQLNPKGYLVFISETNFGINSQDDQIAIINSNDQFQIPQIMQTNGINYDVTPEQVVSKLKDWHSRYSLQIIGAGMDWVEARIGNPPDNFQSFAQEVYQFCPDVVEQGSETVDALAQEMQQTNTLYCWWD
jgi:hypothetical protein